MAASATTKILPILQSFLLCDGITRDGSGMLTIHRVWSTIVSDNESVPFSVPGMLAYFTFADLVGKHVLDVTVTAPSGKVIIGLRDEIAWRDPLAPLDVIMQMVPPNCRLGFEEFGRHAFEVSIDGTVIATRCFDVRPKSKGHAPPPIVNGPPPSG